MNLFICNQGQNRSKTAAELFGGDYAGIYSEDTPVTKEKLENASNVFVFEDHQRSFIGSTFPKEYMHKRIMNLDIPDVYAYNSDELKKLLKKKIRKEMVE